MGFIKKIWKDRISEFPTRRSLTKTDGTSELVTVARSEGMISEEGDAFSAENMNDFENRVANGFSELTEKLEETWNSRNILLWENPNIKTSFTAQTITLSDSLDNYSYFEIYLTLGINNSNIENGYSKFIISDEFTRFDVMNNNTNELYYRIITRDLKTPNKLTISNAYTGGGSTGNMFIPYKIYGIK